MAPRVTGRTVGELRKDGTRPFILRYHDSDTGGSTILYGTELPWEYGKTVIIRQILMEHDGTVGATASVRLYTNSSAQNGDQLLLKKICALSEDVFQWDTCWPYNEGPTRGGAYLVATYSGHNATDDVTWAIMGDVYG